MSLSRFVTRNVERFDLGGGDWVDLLARLSYNDRGAIEEKLLADTLKITGPDSKAEAGSEPEIRARLASANLELLKRVVVAWDGPGFCVKDAHPHDGACVPSPINEATLGGLDETAERILEELVRRMVKPSKDFSPTPSQPTPMAEAEVPTDGA